MARIMGRRIYAADLEERRILDQLGVSETGFIPVPRKANPYIVARRLHRAAHNNPDVDYLRGVMAATRVAVDVLAEQPDAEQPSETDGPSSTAA